MQICPGCSCESRQGHNSGEESHLHLCWGCRMPAGHHTSITCVFKSVKKERPMIHFSSTIHTQSCSKKWATNTVTDIVCIRCEVIAVRQAILPSYIPQISERSIIVLNSALTFIASCILKILSESNLTCRYH